MTTRLSSLFALAIIGCIPSEAAPRTTIYVKAEEVPFRGLEDPDASSEDVSHIVVGEIPRISGKRLRVIRDHVFVCQGTVREQRTDDKNGFLFERDDDGRPFDGLRPGDRMEGQL